MNSIIDKQRNYFFSGATRPIDFRINALKRLADTIKLHESKICDALTKDLGKSNFESYMCEIGMVQNEIRHMIKHVKSYSASKTVRTPISQFHSHSYEKPSPYGVVLIMSPWNYPFLLTIGPLIDALAAGNTAIIKPSAYSSYTSKVISDIIRECFLPEYVTVITGGRLENAALLNSHFDYIFFTGSQSVGHVVMEKASVYLTPVTLELGGKSPCIVEADADLELAAKRIVFGKYLNCGQTCVAPDYILCDEKIKTNLIIRLKEETSKQYGKEPLLNQSYGKIINEKHFNRIINLIDEPKVVHGGRYDFDNLKIEPTIMSDVSFKDAVMQEEIFGPVLPVITYNNINNVIKKINSMPHPLALYIFTSNKHTASKVTNLCSFGGGCINDTIIHLATNELGFGGFGESGMGSYHGKRGFDTFSHYKSIVDKKTWLDLPIRYQPYSPIKEKLLRLFLK